MKEQVFFIIEGQELVLDQVLVEFDETPIFFVCKYNQDYFISSCADLEEERYIVTRISLNRLSKMLHGKITMRELILQSDKFWDIIVGEDAGKDIVVEESISKMPLDVLPYEGAYLKIATEDLEEYVEKIDAILYGEEGWENEMVQEHIEYIKEIVKSLDNPYEIIIQHICERVIKNMKIRMNYNFHGGDYNKEIRNSKVEISKNDVKVDIKLLDAGKIPFAA